jgi:peptidyl-prolyl cis-trans isomerase C
MKRQLTLVFALTLIVGACGKKDAEKTAPGSDEAKNASAPAPAPVEKATGNAEKAPQPSSEETAPTAPEAAAAKGSNKGADLKIQPTDKPASEGTAPAATQEKRITGPVALVNGKPIESALYYAEVDKIMKRSAKIPPERLNRIKDNILKRLVEKELIRQAVQKEGVTVPAKEIDNEFSDYKKRFRTEEQFQNYLKHGKVTVDSIKSRITEKKELEKLLEKTGKLSVTDAEVAEFYKKNERFYQERAGVKARHILVKVGEKAADAEVQKAQDKLKEAQAELAKGTDFGEVAKKFSEGPSAPKGGDLGFFGKGQMVKPFEEAAFKLAVGTTSEPVRTRFGFHLIKVEEKREARKKTLEEVSSTIQDSLRNKKFFQERRTLLNTLKAGAKIERKIDIPKAPARPVPNDPHHGMVKPRSAPTGVPQPALKKPAAAAPSAKPAAAPSAKPAAAPSAKPAAAPSAKPAAAPSAKPAAAPSAKPAAAPSAKPAAADPAGK